MRVERLEEIVSRAEREHGSRTRYNAWLHRLLVEIGRLAKAGHTTDRSTLEMLVRKAHGPHVDEEEANDLVREIVRRHEETCVIAMEYFTYYLPTLNIVILKMMQSSHWTLTPDGSEKPHNTP